TAGNYTVTLTVTDNDGATDSATASVSVTEPVNQPPTANANGPYIGTTNSAISFSSAGSTDSDGNIASYAWDFGDGNTSSSANPSHAYPLAGSYVVTLTVTDNDGATASTTATVTVNDQQPGGLIDACASQGQVDYINLDSGTPYCVTSSTGSKKYFYFYNTSGAQATLRTEHGSGDATLYYSNTSWPTTSQYTNVSDNSGNSESIIITNLANGWNHIMIDGAHSGMTIQLNIE
ncbi:MAG: PKD domain-containing protein, partial [Kangiellaceae bacterium]|nr:PKD domain-containing protein [Kangiellaceae bacterium]